MANKIWDLVQEDLNRIPNKLKPFLHRNQPPMGVHPVTLSYMAFSYGRAFEEMAEAAMERGLHRDYIVPPLFFLTRHSMELHLKSSIKDFQNHVGDTTIWDIHNLMKLWNALTKLVGEAGYSVEDDDYGRYCVKLLDHINEADPDGERFRYPYGNKGELFVSLSLDLVGLVKAHWHVTTYADGCSSMLAEGER